MSTVEPGSETENSRSIAVIATERTGTNYFIGLLNKGTDLNCGYEIFHQNQPFGLNDAQIASLLPVAPDCKRTPATGNELAELVRYNSVRFIDAIAKEKIIDLFKIFPGHLPMVIVRDFILLNSNLVKIVIDRKPIDTYISYRKAASMAQWDSTDTTNMRVNLFGTPFFAWLKTNHAWYQEIEQARMLCPDDYISLHYDEINGKDADSLLDGVARDLNQLGVDVRPMSLNESELLKKQDKNTHYESKVNNWRQFCSSIDRVNPSLIDLRGFGEIEEVL